MSELAQFDTSAGPIIVEIDDSTSGFELVARDGVVTGTRKLLEETLASVRDVTSSALSSLRGGVHAPDTVEVEFGVKLIAKAGAVVAKTATEGHFLVRLRWASPPAEPRQQSDAD
jgi:hypothetical protein